MIILLILIAAYTLFVILCSRVNSRIKNSGLEGIESKECFNPKKMFSVVFGYILKLIIPSHVFEQYVLRFYSEGCRPCLDKGSCVACGCDTKAKMWSPLEKDSKNNWGPIIWSRGKYDLLRSKYPAEVKIFYKKENKE